MNYQLNFLFKIILFVFFSFIIKVKSQSTSISYQLVYKPNSGDKEKIKKQNYELDILGGKSIFRTESRRSSDSLIAKTGFGLGYNTDPHH